MLSIRVKSNRFPILKKKLNVLFIISYILNTASFFEYTLSIRPHSCYNQCGHTKTEENQNLLKRKRGARFLKNPQKIVLPSKRTQKSGKALVNQGLFRFLLLAESKGFCPALPAPIASLRSLPRRRKQSPGLFSSASCGCSLLVRIPCFLSLLQFF